jgi:hypothetical protein
LKLPETPLETVESESLVFYWIFILECAVQKKKKIFFFSFFFFLLWFDHTHAAEFALCSLLVSSYLRPAAVNPLGLKNAPMFSHHGIDPVSGHGCNIENQPKFWIYEVHNTYIFSAPKYGRMTLS